MNGLIKLQNTQRLGNCLHSVMLVSPFQTVICTTISYDKVIAREFYEEINGNFLHDDWTIGMVWVKIMGREKSTHTTRRLIAMRNCKRNDTNAQAKSMNHWENRDFIIRKVIAFDDLMADVLR